MERRSAARHDQQHCDRRADFGAVLHDSPLVRRAGLRIGRGAGTGARGAAGAERHGSARQSCRAAGVSRHADLADLHRYPVAGILRIFVIFYKMYTIWNIDKPNQSIIFIISFYNY